jgi:DNA-directed RNA polymerase specialized sigma subunit
MSSHETSETNISEEDILQQLIEEYISTLNEREKQVMEIAKEHLQSSFCIERSVGFVKWKNSNKK